MGRTECVVAPKSPDMAMAVEMLIRTGGTTTMSPPREFKTRHWFVPSVSYDPGIMARVRARLEEMTAVLRHGAWIAPKPTSRSKWAKTLALFVRPREFNIRSEADQQAQQGQISVR